MFRLKPIPILALLVLMLGFAWLGERLGVVFNSESDALGEEIAARVASVRTGEVVDFATIGGTRWTVMVILSPYTPEESVKDTVGVRWGDANQVANLGDGSHAIVLRDPKRVITWDVVGPRPAFEFVNRDSYERRDARFRVKRGDSGTFLVPYR